MPCTAPAGEHHTKKAPHKESINSLRHEAAHLNRTATAKQPKSQMDRPHHGLEVKSPQKENRNEIRLDEVRGQEKASLV